MALKYEVDACEGDGTITDPDTLFFRHRSSAAFGRVKKRKLLTRQHSIDYQKVALEG